MPSSDHTTPSDELFGAHYIDWRQKRIDAILRHYGERAFLGRTMLELGCGYGDIGGAFAALGARVTGSDARPEHIARARERYPHIEFVCADLDHDWPFSAHYDFILHMGVLYHLEPTHQSLHHACRACEHLLLETEVCDSSDPASVVVVDEPPSYDQAFSRKGCRPSASRVERILVDQGMHFERVGDARCNSGFHVYDWPCTDTGAYRDGLRRFWFAHRRPSHEMSEASEPIRARRGRVERASRDLPGEYARFLNDVVAMRIAAHPGRRLGVLGAGHHTTVTFRSAPWLLERVHVLADSNPALHGQVRFGLTVESPAALAGCDLVYLSSACFAEEMSQTLAATGFSGLVFAPEDIVPDRWLRID